MGKLDGKTAIVTGAARRLGRAYAKRLAGLGAKLAVADLTARSPRLRRQAAPLWKSRSMSVTTRRSRRWLRGSSRSGVSSVLPFAAVASLPICRRRHEPANLSREQAGEFDRRRVLILRADNLQARR